MALANSVENYPTQESCGPRNPKSETTTTAMTTPSSVSSVPSLSSAPSITTTTDLLPNYGPNYGSATPNIAGTERSPKLSQEETGKHEGEISCYRCDKNPRDVKFTPCDYSLCFICYDKIQKENQKCPWCIPVIPFRRHSWEKW